METRSRSPAFTVINWIVISVQCQFKFRRNFEKKKSQIADCEAHLASFKTTL